MNAARFVFLDETAATTAVTRLRGWGERGERLVDTAPRVRWQTTTFVAGLRGTGVVAPLVLSGPMTGAWFRAYVEQVLAPALQPRRRGGEGQPRGAQGGGRAGDHPGGGRERAVPAA